MLENDWPVCSFDVNVMQAKAEGCNEIQWWISDFCLTAVHNGATITESGGNDEEVPPVPIPNTAVKLFCAESTWLDTAREDRSLPDAYSSVAQWQSTRLLTGLL